MLIIGIIVFGVLVGGLAQMVLGRKMDSVNWSLAVGAGLLGSFVGGLLVCLLAGDGLAFRPSGLIGSFVGALILTLIWQYFARRGKTGKSRAN